MPTATVLKREMWYNGRPYFLNDVITYDLIDISEMKIRHVLGEVQLDAAEMALLPTSPPPPTPGSF